MKRTISAGLAALAVLAGATPAEARAVPVRAGTMTVVDDAGWVAFDFDVIATTAQEVGDGQVDLYVPMRVKGGVTRYPRVSGGPVVRFRGRYPSDLAVRGVQTWRLVDRRDGRVTRLRVVVRRAGGR